MAHEGVVEFSANGEGGIFIRGDADQDGHLEITDAVSSLEYLYLGGVDVICLDALDVDDDARLNLSDAIITLSHLYLGGPPLTAPYPEPGADPTPDGLNCDNGRIGELRRELFTFTCATASCHSVNAAKGALVLDGLRSYGELVGVVPDNKAAREAGLLLVKPGHPEESFLYRKITGDITKDEGDSMPQVGRKLPEEWIERVRKWIEDGAAPSIPEDILLPAPFRGQQVLIPAFPVPVSQEVERTYYFKLKNDADIWVNRIEVLYPPGKHHLNLFTGQPSPRPDGDFDEGISALPFSDWALRATSRVARLDWRLPSGVGMRFKAQAQVLAQIHCVNGGSQISPIGGCAAVNVHSLAAGANPVPMGSLLIQNQGIHIPPQSEVSFDYGVTFSHLGHDVPVKLAGVTGQFHSRGKTFEVRLWDGANQSADGSPQAGEFERMGPENTIYFNESWEDPPFKAFTQNAPEIPARSGIVYRVTYLNGTDQTFCFGSDIATQERANVFLYFYPAASAADFLWFPAQCDSDGCRVSCP